MKGTKFRPAWSRFQWSRVCWCKAMDVGATGAPPFRMLCPLCQLPCTPRGTEQSSESLLTSLQIPDAPLFHGIGRTQNKSIWATQQINDDEEEEDTIINGEGDRAHVRNHYDINSETSLFLTFILWNNWVPNLRKHSQRCALPGHLVLLSRAQHLCPASLNVYGEISSGSLSACQTDAYAC